MCCLRWIEMVWHGQHYWYSSFYFVNRTLQSVSPSVAKNVAKEGEIAVNTWRQGATRLASGWSHYVYMADVETMVYPYPGILVTRKYLNSQNISD